MAGVCDLWCEGCRHLMSDHWDIRCEFLCHTGQVRGCPAGTGCTRRDRPEKYRPDRFLQARERARLAKEATQAKQAKAREAALAARAAQEPRSREGLLRLQTEALVAWRRRQHLYQPVAAELAGVTLKTYREWEWGKREADWAKLEKAGCARP